MDWQTILIYVVSGVIFIALLFWLVGKAVKGGAKSGLPTTKPYDTEDAPPPSDPDR